MDFDKSAKHHPYFLSFYTGNRSGRFINDYELENAEQNIHKEAIRLRIVVAISHKVVRHRRPWALDAMDDPHAPQHREQIQKEGEEEEEEEEEEETAEDEVANHIPRCGVPLYALA